MMRVEVIAANVVDTKPGDVVDLDESKVNVGALIKSGAVRVAAPKPKPAKKSATDRKADN